MITNEDFHVGLGLPRSGKTLSQIENELLPEILAGMTVYSNTWINLELENNITYHEFEEIKHVRNCIVHMDEICHVFDPRDWQNESKEVRDFWQLHGHRHVGLITNTQHISLVPKSALIEVSRYFMCEKLWNSDMIKNIFPNFPWVVVQETELSLQEIKALDSGFIAKNYSEDDDDDDMKFSSEDSKSYWFNKTKLMHRELNDLKKELIHWYCPICKQRQGELIPKNESEKYADFNEKKGWTQLLLKNELVPKCPKHKNINLEIKESGIYDSYYEFEVIEKEVEFRPFYKAIKEVPFRGRLSERQLELKNKLEKSFETN